MTIKAKYIAALAATGALALAGCGASNSGGEGGEGGSGDSKGSDTAAAFTDCTVGESFAAAEGEGTGEDKDTELTIGAFNGWDESFATAHLLKAVLEEEGYTVKVEAFEAAPAFAGVAAGDIDIITDAWMPVTHPQYIEQFGDDIEHLGCWYDNAKLTLAVNEDSPAKSIEDLPEMADEYGGKIYGIEPGAGLTKTTQEKAIPEYGLEDYEFVVSSTPAMLTQVQKATDSNENVLVTLWRPHWAYSSFPMRDLEDPKGAMGDAEIISSAARSGFAEENPRAAQIIKNLALDDEQLSSLEDNMMNPEKHDGANHDAAVADWLKENPEFADQLIAGELNAG